jgi:hypothetical protein
VAGVLVTERRHGLNRVGIIATAARVEINRVQYIIEISKISLRLLAHLAACFKQVEFEDLID